MNVGHLWNNALGAPSTPWWLAAGVTPWAAYQAKGVASFAASLVDLSGNGNDAGDPGGAATPPWDAVNGWKFDGVADYLTTTFVPAGDASQTQSMIIQYTNNSASSGNDILAGLLRSGAQLFMFRVNPTTPLTTYSNGGVVNISSHDAAANLCVAGNQGYRNGVAEGGAISGWSVANGYAVYIGCENNLGSPDLFAAYYCQAFALYDCTLTAPQVLAVATAMAAL